MGLITRIIQFFSSEEINNKERSVSRIQNQNAAISIFQDYSQDLPEIGDEFEVHTKKNIKNTPKLRAKDVRKKQGISLWEDILYDIKNIFRAQDIKSRLERKYGLTENAGIDAYKEKAKAYFQEQLGDISGLTEEEINERYEDITKELYLQIINAGVCDKETIEIISAAIGELKADKRVGAAEDLIGLASNSADTNIRARSLARNGEYNVTHKDAFGNTPDNATEYHNLVFANMGEQGVLDTLSEMNNRADFVEKRIKELELKGNLTQEELLELSNLRLVHNNYIVDGFAGGYTGISANGFIGQNFADEQLAGIYDSTNLYGIQKEVFDEVMAFMQEHPEAAELIALARGQSFVDIMNRATNGAYGNHAAEVTGTAVSANPAVEVNQRHELTQQAQNVTANKDKNHMSLLLNEEKNNKQIPSGKIAGSTVMKKNTTTVEPEKDKFTAHKRPESLQNKPSASQNEKPQTFEAALKQGGDEYLAYLRDNNIGYIKACIKALNSKHVNSYAKSKALNDYKNLDTTRKMLVFQNLNISAQIDVSKVMTLEELQQIKHCSIDVKKYISNEIKHQEEKQKVNLFNNDFATAV